MEGGGILKAYQNMGGGCVGFNPNEYKNEFAKANYDRVEFLVPKGRKAELKSFANAHGKSMTEFVIEALEAHYDINLSKHGDF